MKRFFLSLMVMTLSLCAWAVKSGDGTLDPGHPFNPGNYRVTLTVADAAAGTTSGSGLYAQGATATLTATPSTGYEFVRWSDGVTTNPRSLTVMRDTTIGTEWRKQTYTVTFLNEDGTELESQTVEYGATPAYTGATPTKPATAQYTYTFDGWTPEVVAVTGAATYTATYSSTLNSYTVTFLDSDGTQLSQQTVAYGSAATAPEVVVPTCQILTWDTDFSNITGDLTVTAVWTEDLIASGSCSSDCNSGYNPWYMGAPGREPRKAGSGSEGLTWKLTCDSVLIISGEGAMPKYNCGYEWMPSYESGLLPASSCPPGSWCDCPWESYRDIIKTIEVEEGVTELGLCAFYDCSKLVSVSLPSTLTRIGEGAFDRCDNLAAIVIPHSVVTIAEGAFARCSRLASITIPSSVTTIGRAAFAECVALTSVVIPNTVTSIGEGAFAGCNALTSLVVQSGNTIYDSRNNCNAIIETASNSLITAGENVTIPADVVSIGNWALSGNQTLTSVILPSGLTSIGEGAFCGCISLTDIKIPASVNRIGSFSFNGCLALDYVEFLRIAPPSMSDAFGLVFSSATYDFYVPCGTKDAYVTALGVNADRVKERTIDITYSITSANTAQGTVAITNEVVNCDNRVLTLQANAKTGYDFLQWSDGNIDNPRTLTIATNTTLQAQWIPTYTITWKNADGTTLATDVVRQGITPAYTGETPTKAADAQYTYTFNGWTPTIVAAAANAIYTALYTSTLNTYTVTFLNEDGTQLSQQTVAYGSSATAPAVVVPECKVLTWDTDFTNITGNLTVTAVWSDGVIASGYTDDNCNGGWASPDPDPGMWLGSPRRQPIPSRLTWIITCDSVLVISGTGAMDSYDCYCWDPVDGGSTNGRCCGSLISSCSCPWQSYKTMIKAVRVEEGVTEIGGNAFSGCTKVAAVSLPSTLTVIGEGAFAGCTQLPAITIPANVTGIWTGAFEGCSALSAITIPNKVTTLGKGAFDGCTGLTSITIPSSVSTIDGALFRNCNALTSVVVEAGNTVFDSRNNCNAVIRTATNELVAACTRTVVPESVTAIGEGAFAGVHNLTSVTLPAGLTTIGSYAFAGCDALTFVEFKGATSPSMSGVFSSATYDFYVPCGTKDAYVTALGVAAAQVKERTVAITYSVTSADENKGTVVISNEQVNCDNIELTLQANAKTGYEFLQWSDGNTDNPRTLTVTGDTTLQAQWIALYTITWKNADGTTLATDVVRHGETPAYTGATPTKATDAQYTYTFNGWTPDIEAAVADAIYTATYSQTVNTYTVTFIDEDSTQLDQQTVAYGSAATAPNVSIPECNTLTWDKDFTNITGDLTVTAIVTPLLTYSYASTDLSKGTVSVTEEVVTCDSIVIVLHAEPNEGYMFTRWNNGREEQDMRITVTQQDYNGYLFEAFFYDNIEFTDLQVIEVTPYTITVSARTNMPDTEPGPDSNPYGPGFGIHYVNGSGGGGFSTLCEVKDGYMQATIDLNHPWASDALQSYPFDEVYWYPYFTSESVWWEERQTWWNEHIEGEHIEIPEWIKAYTITWQNPDGTTLAENTARQGTLPVYPGATPTQVATAQYSYTFVGWSPALIEAYANATYTAMYTETLNSYTVIFQNEDSTVLQQETLDYGETPQYKGAEPTKAADAQYTYTFNGWTPAVAAVTGTATYTATYEATHVPAAEIVNVTMPSTVACDATAFNLEFALKYINQDGDLQVWLDDGEKITVEYIRLSAEERTVHIILTAPVDHNVHTMHYSFNKTGYSSGQMAVTSPSALEIMEGFAVTVTDRSTCDNLLYDLSGIVAYTGEATGDLCIAFGEHKVIIPEADCDPSGNAFTLTGLTNFLTDAVLRAYFTDQPECVAYSTVFSSPDVVYLLDTVNDITICAGESYEWRGQWLSEAGSYSDTVRSVSGCDSVIFWLNLSVMTPVEIDDDLITMCDGSSVMWRGQWLSEAGTYRDTVLSIVTGCDSIIHIVHLSVITPVMHEAENATMCEGGSFVWRDKIYTEAGTYHDTIWSDMPICVGEIYTLNLAVTTPIEAESEIATLCKGESYEWHGMQLSEAGDYEFTEKSVVTGCDSVHYTLTLSVIAPVVHEVEYVTICAGESFEWRGKLFNETGTYTDTVYDAYGCASDIYFLYLRVNEMSNTTINVTACQNEMIAVGNHSFIAMENTSFNDTLVNVMGCDSVVTYVVTVNSRTYEPVENATICAGESFEWRGKLFNETGTYTDTVRSLFGCDSVISLLNLIVLPEYAGEEEHYTLCAGEELYWFGQIISKAGTYEHRVAQLAEHGCDSVYRITVDQLIPEVKQAYSQTVCYGEDVIFNGKIYTDLPVGQQTLYDTIRSVGGCDSVYMQLNLTVGQRYYDSITVTVCDKYVWEAVNGGTYTQSGIYREEYTTVNGCDSIFVLNLTVNESYEFYETYDIWNTELPFTVHEFTYTEGGTYDRSFTSVGGCDSIYHITLNVHVASLLKDTTFATICEGETYTWGGQEYNVSGWYSYEEKDVAIHVLHLTVGESYYVSITDTACVWYVFNGKTYTQSGIYSETLTTANGCDSIIELHLTIFQPSPVTFDTIDACRSYIHEGIEYTETTDIIQPLMNSYGCDSIVRLHINITHPDTILYTLTACESLIWNNEQFTYSQVVHQDFGCDSVVILNLTIHHTLFDTLQLTAWDSYEWEGDIYTESGIYTKTLSSAYGCDSIVTLILTIRTSQVSEETQLACESFYWEWSEQTYTESGDYESTKRIDVGTWMERDSTRVLHLTISQPKYTATTVETLCFYSWHDELYSESGTYVYEYMDGVCVNADTLHLTITAPYEIEEDTTICSGEPLIWHGKELTEVGVYYDTVPSVVNPYCDSIYYRLYLSIRTPEVHDAEYATICSGESYAWHYMTVSEAGTYHDTIWSGADFCATDIYVLHLTVLDSYEFSETYTISDTDLPYTVHDSTYTSAGKYDIIYTTVNGCDSIYHITISVLTAGEDSLSVDGVISAADMELTETSTVTITPHGHLVVPFPVFVHKLLLDYSHGHHAQVTGVGNIHADIVEVLLNFPTPKQQLSKHWFAFAVPFEVSVATGIRIAGEDTPARFGYDFVLDEFDGAQRAAKQKGWKRVAADAILRPGRMYMLATPKSTSWVLTAADPSELIEETNTSISAHPSTIGSNHAGWNGIANTMYANSTGYNNGVTWATTYNNILGVYEAQETESYVFNAAMPFFVQVAKDLLFGFDDIPLSAPRRAQNDDETSPISKLTLTDAQATYTDKAYVTFVTEKEEDAYTIGHDLQKMAASSQTVHQLWWNAYDMQLSAYEALLGDEPRSLPIGMYAPEDGDYTLSMSNVPENISIYLTKDGQPVWDILASDYTLQLTVGNNDDYALYVQRVKDVTTDYRTNATDTKVQKIVMDDKIFILRDGKTFNVTGIQVR